MHNDIYNEILFVQAFNLPPSSPAKSNRSLHPALSRPEPYEMHNDIENICFGGGLNIFPSPPWSSVQTLLIWSF